ncbi:hypothetical protein K504DRAFT_456799 [Pleomassaria siparia CBS 279.74]|uniref:Rhodopsin domain-containing protein n=1 Tax=Pleomassaria siparia CBS 279.74 TaxID=1314801 RepID=A0A6G1KQ42_9PLEO|nr:hypothetical protein K504DRAFT_456799 [Pleomassaria siparia CBS 279.74]
MSTGTIIPPSLVDAQPPIVPHGLAKTTIVVSTFLGGLAVFLVGLRLTIRGWLFQSGTRAFGIDDIFLVLALASFISCSVTAVQSCFYGVGTRDADLTPLQMIKAAQYNTYWQLSYVLSIPLCKAAIASALFRVTDRRLYRVMLWAALMLSTIVLLIVIFALVLLCKPWPAMWNPTLGTCGDRGIITVLSYVASGVTIITDWTCAVVPYFVLKDLQMPAQVRYSLIGVLALGGFASIAAIVRLPYFRYYGHDTDVLYYSANITIWSNAESGIGIIAASVPPLRRIFTCLRSMIGSSGIKGNSQGPLDHTSGYTKGSQVKRDASSQGVPLESLRFGTTTSTSAGGPFRAKGDGKGWEKMQDDEGNSFSSKQVIMESTTVMVDSESVRSHWGSEDGRPVVGG